jgi:hypothetical protein
MCGCIVDCITEQASFPCQNTTCTCSTSFWDHLKYVWGRTVLLGFEMKMTDSASSGLLWGSVISASHSLYTFSSQKQAVYVQDARDMGNTTALSHWCPSQAITLHFALIRVDACRDGMHHSDVVFRIARTDFTS